MAIKGGDAIFVGNDQVLLDRLQTAGPGQLQIPTEKIYELGNYESVAVIRDTPDLSYSMDSFDVSTEVEAFLVGEATVVTKTDGVGVAADATFTSAGSAFTSADIGKLISFTDGAGANANFRASIVSVTSGTVVELSAPVPASQSGIDFTLETNAYDLSTALAVNLVSQFKPGKNQPSPFDIVGSITCPFLTLESVSYRFGLRDNARQTYGLRGDSIFYNKGAGFEDKFVGDGVETDFATTHPAYAYTDGSGTRRVLAVIVDGVRLTYGGDYICTSGAVTAGAATETVTMTVAPENGALISLLYSSPDTRTYNQAVHATAAVKPAAIRGRDIDVYVGGYDPDDVDSVAANKFSSVQSVQMDWRVTLDKDEEFGNYYYVAQDFDVPAVTGTITIKPRNPDEIYTKVRLITDTDDLESVGPNVAEPLAVDIVLKDGANGGRTLKRLHSGDCRFSVPGFSITVQQKATQDLPFESDSGELLVYKF